MTEEQFDELHPSAFAVAYRMLGSVSGADDPLAAPVARSPLTHSTAEASPGVRASTRT
jgi:hypothetical protein